MEQRKLSFPILKAAHWAVSTKTDDAHPDEQPRFANWVLWVRIRDLPLDLPLDPNARNPRLHNRVTDAIEATLLLKPKDFVRLNSGLTVVARACHVDSSIASLHLQSFSPAEEEADGRRGDGVLNGGHTYAVIKNVLANIKPAEFTEEAFPGNAVVRVEVQTGLLEADLPVISRARNTSVTVPEFALQHLAAKWTSIERQLSPEVRSRVAFKGGDERVTDDSLGLDVGDLVKLLALFNAKVYEPGKKDPVIAYTGEKALIQRWDPKDYEYLVPRLNDFIRLHDAVVLHYARRFGSTRGVKPDGVNMATSGQEFTLLSGVKSPGLVAPPFVFPVLAALRVFLSSSGEWVVPVDDLISGEEFIPNLCALTHERYRKEGKANAAFFGRNRQVWENLCLKMQNLSLMRQVERMHARVA